jgi:hypothetical protein
MTASSVRRTTATAWQFRAFATTTPTTELRHDRHVRRINPDAMKVVKTFLKDVENAGGKRCGKAATSSARRLKFLKFLWTAGLQGRS